MVNRAQGTRDFLPETMHHRQHVIGIVREVFTRFGFEPLETPAFERLETLMGKYGDEGEKLLFKILARGEGEALGKADLALRYDLTVPLARVVAMNQDLKLPFKRWQMQPVWRADRPQHGRFREFWQCDVDIVGTDSAVADAECLAVVSQALTRLGFANYTIRLNDRRILSALAAHVDSVAREGTLLVAIDKLDKIGVDGVNRELSAKGFAPDAIDRLWTVLEAQKDGDSTLEHLSRHLGEAAAAGISRVREVRDLFPALGGSPGRLLIDPTLARGLDYYTGPVFETVVDEPKIGSISGGGRYDNLIGMFAGGKAQFPAVGVSLGLERIITVMEELGMFPGTTTTTAVFVPVFDDATRAAAAQTAATFREAGVNTELYVGTGKLKAQFKYANARGFPWLALVGPDEAAAGKVALKHLGTGEQEVLTPDEAVRKVRAAL